jgi:Uma2 family endonuclease
LFAFETSDKITAMRNFAYKKVPLTDEDYLRIEREAFEKSEFIGGRIVAMAGASDKHNVISSNLMIEIGVRTKNTSCRPFASDMRVKAKIGNYYYPDVVVVCGDRIYEDHKKDSLLNPKVIIEVLSKSTRLKDRNAKLDSYMSLESLTDYVLVEQDQMFVEHYIKTGEKDIRFRLLSAPEDKLSLESISCEITLEEIYRDIEFSKK